MVATQPITSLKSLILSCEQVLVSVAETENNGWVVIVEGVESKDTTVCKIGSNQAEAYIAANAIGGLLASKDEGCWVSEEDSP